MLEYNRVKNIGTLVVKYSKPNTSSWAQSGEVRSMILKTENKNTDLLEDLPQEWTVRISSKFGSNSSQLQVYFKPTRYSNISLYATDANWISSALHEIGHAVIDSNKAVIPRDGITSNTKFNNYVENCKEELVEIPTFDDVLNVLDGEYKAHEFSFQKMKNLEFPEGEMNPVRKEIRDSLDSYISLLICPFFSTFEPLPPLLEKIQEIYGSNYDEMKSQIIIDYQKWLSKNLDMEIDWNSRKFLNTETSLARDMLEEQRTMGTNSNN